MIKTILSTLILATISLTASAEYMVKIPLDVAVNLNAGTPNGLKTCDAWLPTAANMELNVSFTQSRNCTQNYTSISNNEYEREFREEQESTGTLNPLLSNAITGFWNVQETFSSYRTNSTDYITSIHKDSGVALYMHNEYFEVFIPLSTAEQNRITGVRIFTGSNNGLVINKFIQGPGQLIFRAPMGAINYSAVNLTNEYRVEFIYN